MGKNTIELTDANFDAEVLQSDVPVLVDFWAVWCGPCRAIAPHVEALAEEYEGRLKVGKVNVDDASATAAQYRITSIPTLLLFSGGQVKDQIIGVRPKASLVEAVEKLV